MAASGREGGFIKLHRRIQSWPLWRAMSPLQRMVWLEMLFAANWKDDVLWYGTRRIEVRRGQLAHSEAELARRAEVGRKVVRDTIAKLLAEGAIRRERGLTEGQCPHLITIVNYDKYQGNDDDEGPAEGQGRAKVGPSSGPARALREEEEEEEEGKNKKKKQKPRAEPEEAPASAPPPLSLAPDAAVPRARAKPVVDPSPVLIVMPCVGKPAEYAVTEAKVREWQEAYPGVDVKREVRALVQWARDNPSKRKTYRGAPAFFSRNLARKQDKGGTSGARKETPEDAAVRAALEESERYFTGQPGGEGYLSGRRAGPGHEGDRPGPETLPALPADGPDLLSDVGEALGDRGQPRKLQDAAHVEHGRELR